MPTVLIKSFNAAKTINY